MKNCPYCSQPIYPEALRCPFCGRNLDFELAKALERQKTDREAFARQAKLFLGVLTIFGVVLVAILWGALYSPFGSYAKLSATQTAAVISYCDSTQVRAAAHQLIDYNERWADIMALAVRLDHDPLVIQVDRLQKIRRDARAVETPDCLRSAKKALVDGMDEHINGFLAYLQGERLEKVNETLIKGNFTMNEFADEVERIQRCAPNCR